MSEFSTIKTSLGDIIESDVVFNIFLFLGLKESTRGLCRANKLSQKKYREFYTTTKLNAVPSAKLIEKSGRIICGILDALRWAVLDLRLGQLSPAAQRVVHDMNDLQKLRGMGLHEDLVKLNVYVYSYWHRGAATKGVFRWFTDTLSVNPQLKWDEAVENDVKYWKDSRLFGDFFLLFDREDGSILVSTDFKKVYLVLGHANSIGECLRVPRKPKLKSIPTFHDTILGARLSTSLLNWEGGVVYDGLVMNKGPMTLEQRRGAFRAYVQAVDKGVLITALERKLVSGTTASSSSSLPKKTGNVTAKPVPPSPPTTIPAHLSSSVNSIITRITNAKSLYSSSGNTSSTGGSSSTGSGGGGNMSNALWVCRRFGYTEQENPQHIVAVMQGGCALVPYHQYSALVPSMHDMLVLFDTAVRVGGGKPGAIAVDVEYAVDALQSLLECTGMHVMYYPPPSAEEQAYSDLTNPYLTPSERMQTGPVCAVCRSEYSTEYTALLKCARCKSEYYCSKEHQKVHWKKHKHVCVQV